MRLRAVIVVAAALPLAAVGFAIVPHAAGERWSEMLDWADRTEREWAQRDFERAPAWGDTHPGEAHAAYDDALGQARVLAKGDRDLLRELRLRPQGVAPAEAEAFARRWDPCLQALRVGAHCADARPRVAWQEGFGRVSTDLLDGRDLTSALAIEVRRLVASGDGIAAVQLLLDGGTFATDLERSPYLVEQLIAGTLLGTVAAEVLRDAELLRLPAAALALLDDGLARLDQRCLLQFDGIGETLLLARTLSSRNAAAVAAPRANAPGGDAPAGLRYGWSRRWAQADAVLLLVAACESLQRDGELPWAERRAALERACDGLRGSPNRVLATVAPDWTGIELVLRRSATQLRLLRLAVAFHRGGQLPVLADPLGGGPLAVERRADGAVFRSAGGDADSPLQRAAVR